MNLQDLNVDVWAAKLSGVAGALTSMRFLKGSWPERLTAAALGAVLSYYASDWLANKVGLPLGLTGYLLGLFGMAVVSRAWEWVQSTPVAAIWTAILDRIKPKTGGQNGN